jgi:formylmethanofuran dehydrogenase subunit B
LRDGDQMSALEPPPGRASAPWTCPFCPLLCDTFAVGTGAWSLIGSECGRARAGLARFGAGARSAQAQIDGVACDTDAAIEAAARMLAASRQPLFGGLGTDVAGARALYGLACRTGAICDPAGGAALSQGSRALQDRGAFTTTLAEVRTRADLIVCIGSLPSERYPEFLRRCGAGEGGRAQLVVLQPGVNGVTQAVEPGIEVVPVDGDLFDVAAMLAAQLAGRAVGDSAGPLGVLAARLHAARYAVLVLETVRLPAHGALIVEAIDRIVATLNQRTRAAALHLGGDDGSSTVSAVFTWMSGLPLRTRAAPAGLEHEPVRFDAQRLLADHAIDALLWIASFGTEPAPPAVGVPRVVLGHPGFAAAARGRATVFIPVSTPGIGSAGHLFRTEGSVLMPLRALRDDGLPTVADVLKRLTQALPEQAA